MHSHKMYIKQLRRGDEKIWHILNMKNIESKVLIILKEYVIPNIRDKFIRE